MLRIGQPPEAVIVIQRGSCEIPTRQAPFPDRLRPTSDIGEVPVQALLSRQPSPAKDKPATAPPVERHGNPDYSTRASWRNAVADSRRCP